MDKENGRSSNGSSGNLTAEQEADLGQRLNSVRSGFIADLFADLDGMKKATLSLRRGAEIAKIYDSENWRERRDKNGVPYVSWPRFCIEQLGMQHGKAFDLIDLFKNYDEAMVREFGSTKLLIALRAPEQDRPQIMAMIEARASVKVIKQAVAESKVRRGQLGAKRDTGRQKVGNAPVLDVEYRGPVQGSPLVVAPSVVDLDDAERIKVSPTCCEASGESGAVRLWSVSGRLSWGVHSVAGVRQVVFCPFCGTRLGLRHVPMGG
jgi:hypothetical protein